jgi:1,4-dihydroxy-2-naphthoate octaprenyltransferase
MVLAGELGVWVLLVLLAIPRLIPVLKAFSQPRPSEPPPDYPFWPLWFVSLAFVHTRLAASCSSAGWCST